MNRDAKKGVRHAVEVAVPYARSAGRGAVRRTRQAGAYLGPRARQAAQSARVGYDERLVPRLERARAAAGPTGRAAKMRSEVAMAALRGDIGLRDVRCAVRRRERRARMLRVTRRMGVLGLAAGGAYAAWKWWERQSSPDWLMEPAPPTEVPPEDLADMEEAMDADADAEREAG